MSVKRKEHARQFGLNLIMIFAALLCLIPFALIVMSSFSEYMQNLVLYRIIQKCPKIKGFMRFTDH